MGIFVSGVQEGSPAEEQGIREGDQILQVTWRWLAVGVQAGWVALRVCYSLCPPPGLLRAAVTRCPCLFTVVPLMALKAGVCDLLSVSVVPVMTL